MKGIQINACAQKGSGMVSSSSAGSKTISAPIMVITKKAGPSPASSCSRSSWQTSHCCLMRSNPSNRWPSPQRGQRWRKERVLSDAASGSGSGLRCAIKRPTHRQRRKGRATPHRQNASTMRQTQSLNARLPKAYLGVHDTDSPRGKSFR